MKFLLVLIIVAAIGGYFTRPAIEAHRATAAALFAAGKAETRSIEPAARTEKFENWGVATKYSLSAFGEPLLDCWGAYTRFLCFQPASVAQPSG